MTLVALFAMTTGAWADGDIALTSTDGKVWTLDKMPASEVELEVEYYPAATATAAPTATTGDINTGSTTALVTAGTAAEGTMMYAVTTTNTKPTTTEGFSATVPTAKDITTAGTVYVWYYIAGDATHSDSEISATPIEVTVSAPAAITVEEEVLTGETVKTDIQVDIDEAKKEVTITSAVPTEAGGKVVAIPAKLTIGGVDYKVTSIDDDAFAGQADILDIYLPETDTPLKIGKNGLKIDDTHIAKIHVSLHLLDDYSTFEELMQNVKASKLVSDVTPKNQYWSFSCGADVDVPEGVKVYKCKLNDEGTKVIITQIKDSELGGIIKANNGVLLSGTGGNTYQVVCNKNSNKTTIATDDVKSYGKDNLLEPVIESMNFAAGDYYVLYNNEFHSILDNASKVPACLAVLHKPAGVSASRSLDIDEDDTTGLSRISLDDDSAVWHNINGQRISKPSRKGVYIMNGQKVVIK